MSTAPKFTDEELAHLTDEEREGLLDPNFVDDPVEDSAEDTGAAAADAPEQPPATAADDAAAADPAPAPATSPAADPAAQAPAAADDTPPAPRPAPAMPAYTAPADLDDQMKAVRTQQSELADKFDAGELSAREYEDQRRTLEDKYLDLRDARNRATLSWDAQRNTWENQTVGDFLAQHAEYKPGSLLHRMLDQEVRVLQTTDYQGDVFNPEILAKAHERIRAELGGAAPAPSNPLPKPNGQREIPPTIGGLPPAGEEHLDDGGQWAAISRLSGEEYEQALARLTPDQREAYLNSGY